MLKPLTLRKLINAAESIQMKCLAKLIQAIHDNNEEAAVKAIVDLAKAIGTFS